MTYFYTSTSFILCEIFIIDFIIGSSNYHATMFRLFLFMLYLRLYYWLYSPTALFLHAERGRIIFIIWIGRMYITVSLRAQRFLLIVQSFIIKLLLTIIIIVLLLSSILIVLLRIPTPLIIIIISFETSSFILLYTN